MKSSLECQWTETTRNEYNALIENKYWVLPRLPLGRKTIGSRRVLKIQRHNEGTFEKFKACFVVQVTSKILGAITMQNLRLLPNFVS